MNIFQKKPILKTKRGVDFLNPGKNMDDGAIDGGKKKTEIPTINKKAKQKDGWGFFNVKPSKKKMVRPTPKVKDKKPEPVASGQKKEVLSKLLKIKKRSDDKKIDKKKKKLAKFKISSFLTARKKKKPSKKKMVRPTPKVKDKKPEPVIKKDKEKKAKRWFTFSVDAKKKEKPDIGLNKDNKKEDVKKKISEIKKKIREEDMKDQVIEKTAKTSKEDKVDKKSKFFSFFKTGEKVKIIEKDEQSILTTEKKMVKSIKKPLIETRNLSVTYNLGKTNELSALKDASIKIYDGEYIVFFGPSGCGKSTLLFAIAGLQSATKGEVIVDGLSITNIKKKSMEMVNFHRKKIGIIFQSFHLIPSLNVAKNIGLPQIFDGKIKKKRKQKTRELMERFEILSQARRLPSQLSGGQQQRVAIARSLINDPKILLADEPVGNLDTKSAENVLSILRNLNEEEKRTIILVTHDARHLNFANRVFHMKDGLIIKETINKDIRPDAIKLKEEPTKPVVSKDLELLMRTYSELSSSQLGSMLIPFKAKQLVQDVLTEVSTEQVKIMEKVVEEYLMNIHASDYKMIRKTLDQEIERGGADLDSRTAEKLTEKIKLVLEEVKNLKKIEKRSVEYKTSTSHEKIQHLRKFILDKYTINLKKEISIKRLDQALEMRLKDEIDGVKMRKLLDNRISKGGAGIDKRNTKKIAKEMELIMLLRYK